MTMMMTYFKAQSFTFTITIPARGVVASVTTGSASSASKLYIIHPSHIPVMYVNITF